MRPRVQRWQLLAAGVCLCVLSAATLFAIKPEPVDTELIAQLTQRCQTAMLRDVCGVMKGSAPNTKQGRLFIAGVGEVDAQAFSRLREAGDAMCQEVAVECETDWAGQACKIARALYPDVKISSAPLRVEANAWLK
jgi:hypothetical protein